MKAESEDKAPLEVHVRIDPALRIRIIELGIAPAAVLKAALIQAVKKKEMQLELKRVREKDPRVRMEDLKKNTVRMRKLRGL